MPDTIKVELQQDTDYRFAIRFGASIPVLYADEPPPLGSGTGPTPTQLLAAAVGNCLSDSLLFALRKFKQDPRSISTQVEASVERNEKNRLRVQHMQVHIVLGVPSSSLKHLDRVLAQFEDFCTVTQSVRQSMRVDVEIRDSEGLQIK
jgi:uncharacterized OsmC-like protein